MGKIEGIGREIFSFPIVSLWSKLLEYQRKKEIVWRMVWQLKLEILKQD